MISNIRAKLCSAFGEVFQTFKEDGKIGIFKGMMVCFFFILSLFMVGCL